MSLSALHSKTAAAAPSRQAPTCIARPRLVQVRRTAGPSTSADACSCSSSSRAAVVARAAANSANDMARWQQQVRDGSVANVSVKQAVDLMQQGWVLLDVRPPGEVDKVAINGAVNVPLFVEDPSTSFSTAMKKFAAVSTGGWWLGGTHMIPNNDFLAQVQAQVPKDKGIIIGCQKGLRSLAGAEQLARAGYGKIAWINGGFDTARPGDLSTSNGKDIRYAGIGGLSEVLGWTEVQQEENAGQFMGGVNGVLSIVAVILAADIALFGYEQVMYMMGTPMK